MKITILGAGAMGTLFGGKLALTGNDISLLFHSTEAAEQVSKQGIILKDDVGIQNVKVEAITSNEVKEPIHMLMVFTKSQQTKEAVDSIKQWITPDTYIISLQNGLNGFENLSSYVDKEHMILGVTNFPSDLIKRGHIVSNGRGYTKIARADNKKDDTLLEFNEKLNVAGFNCSIEENIFVDIWEKAAFNIAINTTTAICCTTCGDIGEVEEGRQMVYELADEVVNVANKLEINASAVKVKDTLTKTFSIHKHHYTSMAQDILEGKKTEIEALNGYVIKKAKELGVNVPGIEMTLRLIKVLENRKERVKN